MLASGSLDSVLDGRHYNRGIHAHTIVAEAMRRLKWVTFRKCNEKQHDAGDIISHLLPK